MIGLLALGILIGYIALSVGVVWFFVLRAKRRGISGWKWGLPAGIIMYMIVFWDLIPTLVVKEYYCEKYAGTTVYITPEQWKAENPGVAESLTWKRPKNILRESNILNERFIIEHKKKTALYIPVTLIEADIVDIKSKNIVAKTQTVYTGYPPLGLGGKGSWKVWLTTKPCGSDSKFPEIVKKYERMGREVR